MRPVPAIAIFNGSSIICAMANTYVDTCESKASNVRDNQNESQRAGKRSLEWFVSGGAFMGSPVSDGMRVDWDVAVAMDDGVSLRADVFSPSTPGRYPVLLTYGPYAKGLAFQEGYPSAWQRMIASHPDVAFGSSNKYQNWEVVDPEKWVPHDYACV